MNNDYLELKKWLEETRDVPLEDMASFFSARCHMYEPHMSLWKKHYEWLSELLPENCETLLDFGCGTGLELDPIFRRFPSLKVTGVDFSEKMLDLLRKKHGNRNLRLVLEDYFLYEPESESFDAAVTFQTLHHFSAEKKREVFKKIYSALKEGGTYLECDYIAVCDEIEKLTAAECSRRRKRDNIPPERFVHFDTPLTLEHELEAIRSAGFKCAQCLGFLEGDNHTAMIMAKK